MIGNHSTRPQGWVAGSVEAGGRPRALSEGEQVLTAAERELLLVSFNDTRAPYPADSCLHQLIEAQVDRSPDSLAVVGPQEQLTYRELNRRANQLAHTLQSLGVGLDHLVCVCLHRSVNLLVAVLGVLKAGAAYVPLDPTYPKERLAGMLADTRAKVLLTEEAALANLAPHDGRLLCLDREWEQIARSGADNPNTPVGPGNLIYAIFTSGSTGRPKLAAAYHRGFVNLMHWFVTGFGITARDRC